MSTSVTVGEVTDFRGINKLVSKILKTVDDLSPAFLSMAIWWFRNNNKLRALKGPGKYEDLAESTKAQKDPDYPILQRSGRLLESIIDRNSPDAVLQIGKQSLIVGSNIDYGVYHQSHLPRKKIPYRPFVFNETTVGFDDPWIEHQNKSMSKMLFEFWQRRLAAGLR